MKHFLWIFIAMAFAISMWACKSKKEMTQSQSNRFKVEQGEVFEIALDANPSTGYQWFFAQPLDSAIVEFVEKQIASKTAADTASMPGAGHQELWYFKGINPGKTQIDLIYSRAHAKQNPAKEKSYHVEVK